MRGETTLNRAQTLGKLEIPMRAFRREPVLGSNKLCPSIVYVFFQVHTSLHRAFRQYSPHASRKGRKCMTVSSGLS